MHRDLPKAMLQLQLDSAAPPALIRGMARARYIDIAGIFDENGQFAARDLPAIWRSRSAALTAIQRPEDWFAITRAVAQDLVAAGVIYAELTLVPWHMGGGDLLAWRDHLAAVAEAAAEAQAEGITLRAVAAAIRHDDPHRARAAARCACDAAGDFVVGFGLIGDDRVALSEFGWAFDCVTERALPTTADAGAARGLADLAAAARLTRITRAPRLIDDLALVDVWAEAGRILPMDPITDLLAGLYPDLRQHPIRQLYHRDIRVAVTADLPAYTRQSLPQLYDRLHDAFDWDQGVFTAVARAALDAAFCDGDTRNNLLKSL